MQSWCQVRCSTLGIRAREANGSCERQLCGLKFIALQVPEERNSGADERPDAGDDAASEEVRFGILRSRLPRWLLAS